MRIKLSYTQPNPLLMVYFWFPLERGLFAIHISCMYLSLIYLGSLYTDTLKLKSERERDREREREKERDRQTQTEKQRDRETEIHRIQRDENDEPQHKHPTLRQNRYCGFATR